MKNLVGIKVTEKKMMLTNGEYLNSDVAGVYLFLNFQLCETIIFIFRLSQFTLSFAIKIIKWFTGI